MDSQQIKTFIDAMARSDLAQMEFSQDGWTLRLVKEPARGPAAASASSTQPLRTAAAHAETNTAAELLAPLFGVVHLRPAPGEPLFVVPGQAVAAGQTLCVIEAMKVFNEVRAERAATVAAVLVTAGEEVEAGQALVRFA